MNPRSGLFCCVLWVGLAGLCQGVEVSPVWSDSEPAIGAEIDAAAKAVGDSIVVMGPWHTGAPYNGQFQNPAGQAAWNGWTHYDRTIPDTNHWQVSDYNAFGLHDQGAGNLAAWCGSDVFSACDASDTLGGYGASWNDALVWTAPVADAGLPATVTIDAWLNIDVEPGYDFVYLEAVSAGQTVHQIAAWDGLYRNLHIQESFTYTAGDFAGTGSDEIILRLRFDSDGGWDDGDCSFSGAGACQMDDVTVTIDNGSVSSFHDFEDGTLGPWEAMPADGVGDFAHLRNGLDDLDPCRANTSYQVCFIDDGEVVPGTGGTKCETWCYGPGGYIVNSSGGLLGPDAHLDNVIQSPVMAWPSGKDSGSFEFDLYWHLGRENVIYYTYGFRSTASSDPQDIENAGWADDNFWVFDPGPHYRRRQLLFDGLLEPETRFVQVRFQVMELGYIWGWDDPDNTPAPYFDNARVTAFDASGPSMGYMSADLAADGFPASGELDLSDPGSNSVRFDMGRSVADAGSMTIVPGDSVVVLVRTNDGSALAELPRMHYRLLRNPVFDPYRTSGLPDNGTVEGVDLQFNSRYAFDLPDEGFLFPGDQLHYYFRARDGHGRIATLPTDTTGFSGPVSTGDVVGYDLNFSVQALPTVPEVESGLYTGPKILFWDDAAGRGGTEEWLFALENLGLVRGEDFDVYRTRQAYAGQGNGLGARATLAQVEGYETILYSSGSDDWHTLGDGDPDRNPSPDLQLLDSWLRLGDRDLLLTGNQLASSLTYLEGGPAFLSEWMGLSLVANSHTWDAGFPQSPEVVAVTWNPVLVEAQHWIAFGGCPAPVSFDVVEPIGDAVALALFVGSTTNTSAMTLNQHAASGSRVISMPYDLSRVWDPGVKADQPASIAVRARILAEVLSYFGNAGFREPAPVPLAGGALRLGNHPNPFNPVTEIRFDLPRAARVQVKVYNVQGRLVAMLLDEERSAGPGRVVWNGTDSRGGAVASGTYFYRVRAGEEEKIGKMTLLK